MFGYTTIRTEALDSLKTEIKGFYAQTAEVNEYFQAIQRQLKGLDMGKIGPITRDGLKEAYETIAPVMGVINYIADGVGDVSKYIELRDIASGNYIEKHWLLDLLNRPNDRFSRRKFFQAWAINRLLFGDAFVYAPRQAGKDGDVREMYVIPGQRVAIEKGGLAAPFKGIRINGSEIDIEGKVFESFDYNLDDSSFYGTSKVAAAAVYLTVMERSMNRQATSLKNGGAVNIVTPAASSQVAALPAQLDDMEQRMNSSKNVNKSIAMKLPIDVHQLGDKPVDLNILGSHDAAMEVLCFVFKVPFDIFKGQAKYENAKEAKKTLYEQIAIPMVNEFAEDLLTYLDLGQKLELVVDTDRIEVLRERRSDVLECLDKMHASLNERREANGYDPIDEAWADEPILPLGIQFGNEAGIIDIDE